MIFLTENASLIFVLMAIAVLGLSVYLGILWAQIRKQKIKNELQEERIKNQLDEQKKYVTESIDIIALATIQGQCDLSECCIRIKNLIDYFPELSEKPKFQVFQRMYEEIKDFPTHEKRNEQTKQETFKQDKERFRIEDKYRDGLLKSLKLLRDEMKSV